MGRLDAADIRDVLSATHSLRVVLHADVVADECHVVPPHGQLALEGVTGSDFRRTPMLISANSDPIPAIPPRRERYHSLLRGCSAVIARRGTPPCTQSAIG